MNLCVIPARGGSKRIPRKNIKEFCGKPMIAYAISAAKESGLFDRVVVSTDDPEISSVASQCGALVPFVRPVELSDDHTTTVPVIVHAIQTCKAMGWDADYVCCIYPCVPFVQVSDIQKTFTLLVNSKANYLFPVARFPSAIQRALKRNEDGFTQPFYPQYEFVRTQDLELAYYDAGQFYWGTANAWATNPRIHTCGLGFELPAWRVVDIDDDDDWKRAECLFNTMQVQQLTVQT